MADELLVREDLSEEKQSSDQRRDVGGVQVTQQQEGALAVTLAVFSGRRDPQWDVPQSDPNYNEIKRLLVSARKDGFTSRPQDMPGRLGFKGFLIKGSKRTELIIGRKTMRLQQLLLDTMPAEMLPEGVRKIVVKEIGGGVSTSQPK